MSQTFLVAVRCPQCAAETDFPEGAHALRCAYCGVVLRVVGAHRGGQARFVMLPTLAARALSPLARAHAAGAGRRLTSVEWQALVFVPFWRARGVGLRWIYFRPAGPPAPAGAADAARAFTRRAAAADAAGPRRERPGLGGALLDFLGDLVSSAAREAIGRADDSWSATSVPPVLGVPAAAGPDGRDLQARHFDLSFPAFEKAVVGLHSLGVRPGVRPLRVLAPDALPAGARMLPLEVSAEEALSVARSRVATQFDEPPGHPVAERRAFVLGGLSAIYFPLWVVTVRVDGAERCLVVDGVAGTVVRDAAPTEPWIADLPVRTPPSLSGASVGFLPLKCPECAHDLPLETAAVVHFCVRCGRAFAEAGDRLEPVPYDASPARGAALYLPAWRFEAAVSVDGRRVAGADDLPRLTRPAGWPVPPRDPLAAERPVSIFVPAFACRDLALLDRLGASLTRLQPRVARSAGADSIPLSPAPRVVGASVEAADAEALAHLLLVGLVPGAGPLARKRLDSLEASLGAPRLFWFPVHDRGAYLQCRLTGLSLRKSSLGWPADGAGPGA